MNKPKVLVVFGTRPEVVKMAPIIRHLKGDSSVDTFILSTSQHKEMLQQMLETFEIKTDLDLDVMTNNQTLPSLTAKLPEPLDQALRSINPNLVLVQGDTTTTFMASLACYYRKIPLCHVEAGLRTGQPYAPFPEEINRVLISRLATWHYAPTAHAKQNLLNEGIEDTRILVPGNPVIDSVDWILKTPPKGVSKPDSKTLFVTTHRRENIGKPQEAICKALLDLVDSRDDLHILCTVHPNPNVKRTIDRYLKHHPKITLLKPLEYSTLIHTLKHVDLILSDSGGIQEEATRLQIPLLILRDVTDRPEGVILGAAHLVGTDPEKIKTSVQNLLDTPSPSPESINIYGDGSAGKRIADHVKSLVTSSRR